MSRRAAALYRTEDFDRHAALLIPRDVELLEADANLRQMHTDLVFPRPPYGIPKDIDEWLRRARARSKISGFRFHDLWRIAPSYLATSCGTLAEVAAVLG